MTSKHTTTSIVDISEIEDDDDEMPLAGATRPTGGAGAAQHAQPAGGAAHLYLFNEDQNPHQRIPNLLSTMVSTQAGAQAADDLSPGQTLLRPAGLAAIDYAPGPQQQQQQLHSAADFRFQAADEAREPSTGAGGSSSRPFTPAGVGGGAEAKRANLGTLSGVYFPCVQNIFGVILFIRMVWIVGTAGVPAAFTLVFICCSVTLTTSISLSAIATNGIVPAGGSYFMISRSLGPEFGGAVGTMFFLGTTVAGAMYITGAVEIMLNYLCPSWGLFGDFQRDVSIMYHNIRVYGTLLLIVVGLLVWIGVKFVSKLAPVALFCVLFSIASIYAGIFINYNGRPDLMICVVGDRLVTLKNMPFEEPDGLGLFEGASSSGAANQFGAARNSSAINQAAAGNKLSAADQAIQFQLRRTRALCTYDKLRYVFCPNELAARQQQQPADAPGYSPDPLGLDAGASSGASVAGEQPPDEQQLMRDLFRRPPNMSNCDPYFRANRDRIHLERAVPGIASGVLFENLQPRFRSKRNIVSYDEGANTNERSDFNFIFVDITTSFTALISIYFPSCTGILAGSNRSGDLADAQKSIPRGTIAAQLTTSFVYLSCIVLFGSTFNNLFIRDKFGESMGGQLAVTQIAWPHPYVILIGGLLSTLGASLQSLVGAPRVLQGIAKDEVIPCFNRFAKLSARGEPETAIIFTLCISWLAVLIGNLDFIAPILTLSLVMCYFFINLACTLHSLLGSPNWRPRFKHYHWSISTLGCLLCLFVMIVSSWIYFLVAIFLAGCIYKYIEFHGAEKEWGDGKQGLALSAARSALLRLRTSEPHTKNWRPQLLLFCKLKPGAELEPPSSQVSKRAAHANPSQQLQLLDTNHHHHHHHHVGAKASGADSLRVAHPKLLTFASQLKAGKGLTLVSAVIEGDFKESAGAAARARFTLQETMREEHVKGFADVLIAPSIADGLSYQVQAAGLGGLKHNTVIVGWPEHWRRSARSSASLLAGAGGAPAHHAPSSAAAPAEPASSLLPQARGSFKRALREAAAAASSAPPSGAPQQQAKQGPPAKHSSRAHQFIELMRNVQVSQNALLVIKGADSWPESCDKLGGFIDIWWIVNDGGLLMLLPHLLRQHRTWKSCQLRIFTLASSNDNNAQMREDLRKFLYHLRIEAQVDIVEMNTTEISDYAYERTLMMEQRSEIIKRLNTAQAAAGHRKQSLLLEQEVDGRLIRFRIRKPSTCDFEDTIPFGGSPASHEHLAMVDLSGSPPANGASAATAAGNGAGAGAGEAARADGQPAGGSSGPSSPAGPPPAANLLNNLRPDEANVRRMHTALSLNEAILKRSKSAKLVIINLPGAPKASTPEAESNYMEFIEIMTDKLERVLLVQNGGREVITIHS